MTSSADTSAPPGFYFHCEGRGHGNCHLVYVPYRGPYTYIMWKPLTPEFSLFNKSMEWHLWDPVRLGSFLHTRQKFLAICLVDGLYETVLPVRLPFHVLEEAARIEAATAL